MNNNRLLVGVMIFFALCVAASFIGNAIKVDNQKTQRGPIDAVVDHMPVCAAAKQDTGTRIVLDGVLRGPCNSTDVGRKP